MATRRIFVSVKPNAKREKVEKVGDIYYRVSVNAPARDGKANKAVISALSEFLGIGKIKIALVSGATSRKKVFDVVV